MPSSSEPQTDTTPCDLSVVLHPNASTETRKITAVEHPNRTPAKPRPGPWKLYAGSPPAAEVPHLAEKPLPVLRVGLSPRFVTPPSSTTVPSLTPPTSLSRDTTVVKATDEGLSATTKGCCVGVRMEIDDLYSADEDDAKGAASSAFSSPPPPMLFSRSMFTNIGFSGSVQCSSAAPTVVTVDDSCPPLTLSVPTNSSDGELNTAVGLGVLLPEADGDGDDAPVTCDEGTGAAAARGSSFDGTSSR